MRQFYKKYYSIIIIFTFPLIVHGNVDSLILAARQHIITGDFSTSLQINFKALELALANNSCEEEVKVRFNIAHNYGFMGNEVLSSSLLKTTADKALACQQDSIYRQSLYGIGTFYLGFAINGVKGENLTEERRSIYRDSFLYFFTLAETIFAKPDAPKAEAAKFFSAFSAYYLEYVHDTKKAFDYARKGYELGQLSEDLVIKAYTTVRMGACYDAIQQPRQVNFFYFKALDIYKQANSVQGRTFVMDALADNYSRMNEADSTKLMLRSIIALKDSIFNAKSAKEVAHYKTLYETEKKEADLNKTTLALQQEKQRTLYISIIAIIVFILIGLTARFLYLRNQTRQQLSLLTAKESERNRIARELHDNIGSTVSFIVSKLDSIIYRTQASEQKQELEQVKNTARDTMINLRETLWTLNNPNITNTELADKLKAYIKRYSLIENQITDNITTEIELPNEAVLAIYRCVQEIINNANKHSQATMLKIDFTSKNQQSFFIAIEDNGIGITEEAKAESYGLRNIKSRLEEIGAHLEIITVPKKGTRFEIGL